MDALTAFTHRVALLRRCLAAALLAAACLAVALGSAPSASAHMRRCPRVSTPIAHAHRGAELQRAVLCLSGHERTFHRLPVLRAARGRVPVPAPARRS